MRDPRKRGEPSQLVLEQHPLGMLLPPMSEDEFMALRVSVRKSGLRDPIVLHAGKVLDGWNRYNACIEEFVQVITTVYQGDFPAVYVHDKYLHRNDSPSARAASFLLLEAAILAERESAGKHDAEKPQPIKDVSETSVATAPPAPAPGPVETHAQQAKRADVSPTVLAEAKRLQRVAPEKLAEVVAGKKSVPKALKEAGVVRQPKKVAAKDRKPAAPDAALKAKLAAALARVEECEKRIAALTEELENAQDSAAEWSHDLLEFKALKEDEGKLYMKKQRTRIGALESELAVAKNTIGQMARDLAYAQRKAGIQSPGKR